MSIKGKAWMMAASVGAVEALKDQGFARWNYPLRSLKKHPEANLRSLAQVKKLSSSSSELDLSELTDEKIKGAEESLRNVMYLSC